MANNTLLTLKSGNKIELVSTSLSQLVESAIDLAKVYLDGKDIELQVEMPEDINVVVDAEILTAVLINLVKNATEAFLQDILEENDVQENGKYIKIKTEKEDDFATICVSNNAKGITEPEKIFNDGFTTKSTGSGLGLWICKKSIEEMNGELELSRSTEDYTEFTIKLGISE
jgi:signal transduction histidine kinase